MMLGIHPDLVRATPWGMVPRQRPLFHPLRPETTAAPYTRDPQIEAWLVDAITHYPVADSVRSTPSPVLHRYWPAPDQPEPVDGAVIVSCRKDMVDVFPYIPETPIARSPRSARQGRQSRLPSRKAGRVIRCASDPEFDHALDCEMSASVLRFVEQPCTLRYRFHGELRIARPDAFVVELGLPEFREVKLEKDAARPENEARWPAIASAFNGMGFGYRVVTERDLQAGGRRDAIYTVYEHRHSPLPPASDIASLRQILEVGPVDLASIRDRIPAIRREQIFAMVRAGLFAMDFNAAPGPETVVMLPDHVRHPQYHGVC